MIFSAQSAISNPPCIYRILQYLTKVPVDPHSFLNGFFAVVETRHSFFVADIGDTAVVVVFVGLDAADVELTRSSIESVLQNKKGTRFPPTVRSEYKRC